MNFALTYIILLELLNFDEVSVIKKRLNEKKFVNNIIRISLLKVSRLYKRVSGNVSFFLLHRWLKSCTSVISYNEICMYQIALKLI